VGGGDYVECVPHVLNPFKKKTPSSAVHFLASGSENRGGIPTLGISGQGEGEVLSNQEVENPEKNQKKREDDTERVYYKTSRRTYLIEEGRRGRGTRKESSSVNFFICCMARRFQYTSVIVDPQRESAREREKNAIKRKRSGQTKSGRKRAGRFPFVVEAES